VPPRTATLPSPRRFEAQKVEDNPLGSISEANTAPALIDLDSDGDYDLLLGIADGTIQYWKNTGVEVPGGGGTLAPAFTQQTGASNPMDGINVGTHSAPALVDIDGDGPWLYEAPRSRMQCLCTRSSRLSLIAPHGINPVCRRRRCLAISPVPPSHPGHLLPHPPSHCAPSAPPAASPAPQATSTFLWAPARAQ
jgi:hypothetical protein